MLLVRQVVGQSASALPTAARACHEAIQDELVGVVRRTWRLPTQEKTSLREEVSLPGLTVTSLTKQGAPPERGDSGCGGMQASEGPDAPGSGQH